MELCSPIKVRWPVYFQFQMNKNVQWQIPPFQTCEIISNSVLESQGWKRLWRVWMSADLDNTKHFGNFFFGFFSFFLSLHENPFKHFTIIPFRIHRFFSQRKILMIRIFDRILDFSKETHPQINITTIIVIIIIIIIIIKNNITIITTSTNTTINVIIIIIIIFFFFFFFFFLFFLIFIINIVNIIIITTILSWSLISICRSVYRQGLKKNHRLLALGCIENSAKCLFYIFPNKSVFVIGAKIAKTVPNYFKLGMKLLSTTGWSRGIISKSLWVRSGTKNQPRWRLK